MYQELERKLSGILNSGQISTLAESRFGLEKESLRVAADGIISPAEHPVSLGSALTNPYITTDFSEALIEMITPPCNSIKEVLAFLDDIHKFVYTNLENETLWATSMPCVMQGEDSIPIAQYGSSNPGMMKTIYRRGLAYRYGRSMQAIAGVHFNYSFSESFWETLQMLEQDSKPLKSFISRKYMGLVRNVQRFGWMIPYLFGASPAVCKSFLHGQPTILKEFNKNTVYEPFATSLRMGDIGYTNNVESMAGITANYDSLASYTSSLKCATETVFDEYEKIGVKVDGEYKQLNANILQIENEYYSTVRPKVVLNGNEKPASALLQNGIEYIEIRSLDVNAFDPMGINEEQLYFLEVLLLFCLLHDSQKMTESEMNEVDINLIDVAHTGRDAGSILLRNERPVLLKDWANELCRMMKDVASLLDTANDHRLHSESLKKQIECVNNSELTTSALILKQMRDSDTGFVDFARKLSIKHADYYRVKEPVYANKTLLEEAARESLEKQQEIEAAESVDFDEYIKLYYAQP